jgi:hypothetical protein
MPARQIEQRRFTPYYNASLAWINELRNVRSWFLDLTAEDNTP